MAKFPSQILFTPLNWGLGHASRCIPIIKKCLEKKSTVSIASDGNALTFLQKEFPNLTCFKLPSYQITYPFKNMELNMALLAPKFFSAILNEKKALHSILENHPVDLIISDNRYGCYHSGIASVFVSHQIHLRGSTLASQWMANFIQQKLLRPFNKIWIPDFPEPPGLGFQLSHPNRYPQKLHYIGPLSRLKSEKIKKVYDITAVLSGPEPARSVLERMIFHQLKEIPGKHALVRGLPQQPVSNDLYAPSVEVFPFLTSADINNLLLTSKVIVSRSGYSTIMDLAKLERTAILIPTPGQTEQEYLAKQFDQSKIFLHLPQKKANLKEALTRLPDYKGYKWPGSTDHLLEEALIS